MEITWYGHSCFRLAERGTAAVVTDPFESQIIGIKPLKLDANIVTVSQNDPEHACLEAVNGKPYVITGPGEYEVGGVFITGIQMGGHKTDDPTKRSHPYTMYAFDFDSMTVMHLGSLNRIPTQAELEAIGTVNIALVPIDESRSLNAARATEVISMLEPNIVIPIFDEPSGDNRSDSLTKFLKEMGVNDITPQPMLKIAKSSLPEETQVIVLEHPRG